MLEHRMDGEENDMGVKEAINILERFCERQGYQCADCPIGSHADAEWLEWGCPIPNTFDDSTIQNALADMEE